MIVYRNIKAPSQIWQDSGFVSVAGFVLVTTCEKAPSQMFYFAYAIYTSSFEPSLLMDKVILNKTGLELVTSRSSVQETS